MDNYRECSCDCDPYGSRNRNYEIQVADRKKVEEEEWFKLGMSPSLYMAIELHTWRNGVSSYKEYDKKCITVCLYPEYIEIRNLEDLEKVFGLHAVWEFKEEQERGD